MLCTYYWIVSYTVHVAAFCLVGVAFFSRHGVLETRSLDTFVNIVRSLTAQYHSGRERERERQRQTHTDRRRDTHSVECRQFFNQLITVTCQTVDLQQHRINIPLTHSLIIIHSSFTMPKQHITWN